MAYENGRLYICDRCGATGFAKCTGEGETDGGYTRWNNFEKLEGWSNSYDAGLLCPACTSEWKCIIEQFKSPITKEE